MTLQAVIDDSKEPPVFVLAGYIASVDSWNSFSDKWRDMLSESGLPYLKGQELTKVLRWMEPEARDARLGEFGKCIHEFANGSVEFSISYSDFRWFKSRFESHFNLKDRRARYRFKNPYFLGFLSIFLEIVGINLSLGLTDEMDFIFDCGIAKRKMLEQGYAEMHSLLPADMRCLINPQPLFRDDKKFLPIQAADLRAWYCHRCLVTGVPPGKLWDEMNKVALTPMHFDREDLADILNVSRSPRDQVAAKTTELETRLRGIRKPKS